VGMGRLTAFLKVKDPDEFERRKLVVEQIDMTKPFEVEVRADGGIAQILKGKNADLVIVL
jgi:hypothetical protein